MTNQMQEAPMREEGIVTRYSVDVGEESSLSEKERRACEHRRGHRGRHARMRHDGWRGGAFHTPPLLMMLAAVALGVALISTAASYPVATLVAAGLLFLFARERFHHDFAFSDWSGRNGHGRHRYADDDEDRPQHRPGDDL